VTLGTGWYNGTNQSVSFSGTGTASSSPSTITTGTVIFTISQGNFKNFKFNLPVQIVTGSTTVANATLFSYNRPNLVIKATGSNQWTVDGTGVRWTTGGTQYPKSTIYTISVNYCDIEENKTSAQCITPSDDNLGPETEVEQVTYDLYEQYNIDSPPDPVVTQHTQYNAALSLGAFDPTAPIPWDYDNMTLNPQDVLWGNIHPNVSQSIFNCAYAREALQSINNLEYNNDTGWSYRSLTFERTWTGDDKQFIGAITFAEFIVETGISMLVDNGYGEAESAFMAYTKWGKAQTAILENSAKAAEMKKLVYNTLVSNNQWKGESKMYAEKYAAQHFANLSAMEHLNESDRAQCKAAYDAVMGQEGSSTRLDNEKRLSSVMEANEAMYSRSNQLLEAKAASAVSEPGISQRVAIAKGAGSALPSDAHSSVKRLKVPETKASGTVQRAVDSIILRLAGAKAGEKMAEKTSGKLAVKLADAIGITMASEGLLWGVAAAWCGASLGTACPGVAAAVTAINVFLDIFVVSCCTYIPAILDSYIPSDAVCPNGYFNIYDAMAKLPGGEVGWLIITSIPGFGDALGTFGPYLCSKVQNGILTDCVLKVPPLSPGYFFDSTLSIFADTTKAAMASTEAQFTDSRKYTLNASPLGSTPAWSNSGIPPIWVDFSDKRMLDKMAQFYYVYSRRLAENNGDGTRTFEYISKIYGVVASSEFTCDIQCEITSVTFYISTGTVQSKQIIPVDPTNGTTYHDRRFYFYAIQVSNPADSTASHTSAAYKAYTSAANIEAAYALKINYNFLTYAERISFVAGNDDNQLNRLMTDNINRYIVTACTHMDGTAPNALEVNGEGEYVGDALISLGEDGNYYPPVANINDSMLLALTSAYTTIPINLGGSTSSVTFTYDNPLITFIMPYRDSNDNSFEGDTVQGVQIDSSNMTVNPTQKFTGTVTNFIAGPPQKLTVNITTNSIPTVSSNYAISVTRRSSGSVPPTNDNGCSAIRSKLYKYGQTVNQEPPATDPNFVAPSYVNTVPSTTPELWTSYSNTQLNTNHRTGFLTKKLWKESLEGEIKSEKTRALEIVTGSVMGYVGFKFNYGMIPVGAIITGGVMNTNFNPDWSIASLMACSYQDMLKGYGTYIMNGRIRTIQEGKENHYLYIDRGPIIAFAPGYTPSINKRTYNNENVLKISQSDCVNRNSVRRAVKQYNTANSTRQVTKVLNIETDTKNTKCLYLFETVKYNAATNLRDLTTPSIKEGVIIPYIYSDSEYALKAVSNIETQFILNSNGTYTPASGPGNFQTTVRSTNFSIIGTPWTQASKPEGAIEISMPSPTTVSSNINLTRQGNTDPSAPIYTCASPNIYNRLTTQFNMKYNLDIFISTINKVYAPPDGVNQKDGTYQCIYDVNVKEINKPTAFPVVVTMTLVPANDRYMSLYDLQSDNYPSGYTYQPVPKPNQWITIPASLVPSRSILRSGCTITDMSGCGNPSIISNLVNQFNRQMIDGKIMKVRKAYTPDVAGSNVCDYEVEMLRTFSTGTSTNSLVQKESIRLPIVPNTTDVCMWNLNLTGSNLPLPDTGISLTNTASVRLLDTPYVWAPSILGNIQQTINGAILNYLNIDIAGILSNTTAAVNREVTNVYETVVTSQKLWHSDPTCVKRCRDVDVTQAIIDGYYVNNYPTGQYGAVQRKMTEVRRVGTYNISTCQVEFIEKVETYKNFISSVIYSSDASNPDAQFNTRYYLRQYQFELVPDPTGTCAYNMSSIRSFVSTGNFSMIDIGKNNAIAIMSDSSVIPPADSNLYSFTGKQVDCARPEIMNAIRQKYNTTIRYPGTTKYNTLTAFSTAFNPLADTCEYTVLTTRWFKSMAGSYYTLPNQSVSIQAQWESYNPRTGIIYTDSSMTTPSILREYDPAVIKFRQDSNGSYQSYDALNNPVVLPYTYKLPVSYNTLRVSSIRYVCTSNGCSF
jgi:hypothetical protein